VSFVLEVKIRIQSEHVENFMAKLAENAKAARGEPGCRTFDVSVDPNDRTSVLLYEVYADEKAFQAHQQTPHFKKYLAEAVPLLASRERRVWKRV
jgi:(4S)-4-hydroxy-5-phosphonooxypentane-2,3-dione isomerase